MFILLTLWVFTGVIGSILRLFNTSTYPSKKYLWLPLILTHIIFGFIGLIYGYICYSSRQRQSKDELRSEYDFSKMEGVIKGKYI